ncbi:MAG: transporter substrate-binding domain-containing protein [Candidatus Aminicenantes bacterium]|nr:transporter substrate-binding domain-containing protein [Candidatus Aminicenantes bacterium]
MKNNNCFQIRRLLFTLFIGLSLLFLTITVNSQSVSKSDTTISKIDRIKTAGKLVMGTSPDYPPYEFHLLNDQEGDIVGVDIDIAKEIAKELGVKLEIKNIVFHKLFDVLNSDEVDLVIAGLAPSERRRKLVDFSDIYYQAIQNMLIRAEDAEKIVYLRDLRGKVVGTQKGSIQQDMAQKQIIGAEFQMKDTINELIEDLKSKKIDAAILEKPVAESFVMRNKDLMNIECHSGAYDALLGSAIAVKKGNNEFLKEINRILQELKEKDKIREFVEDAKILMNK